MLAPQLAQPLAIALGVYLVVMLAIGWWARGKTESHEDFLVADRRLPLLVAWPTLLATWLAASTGGSAGAIVRFRSTKSNARSTAQRDHRRRRFVPTTQTSRPGSSGTARHGAAPLALRSC